MENKDYKLIFVKGEYYLAVEGKPEPGETYLGFATGLRGCGRGFFVSHHDNSNKSKLSAICTGTHRIIASTVEIEGVKYFLDKEQVETAVSDYIPLESEIIRRNQLEAEKAAGAYAKKHPSWDEFVTKRSFMKGYDFVDTDKLYTEGDIEKAIEFGRSLGRSNDNLFLKDKEETERFMENLLKEKVVLFVEILTSASEKYIYIDKIKLPISDNEK